MNSLLLPSRFGTAVARLSLLAAMAVSTAFSAITVCEPDAFAAGTNLNSACAGVTLSHVGSGFSGATASIFAVSSATQPAEPFTASTGSLVFGTAATTFPHLFREPSFSALRATFASGVTTVGIDYISNDSNDVGFLQAFSAANVLLGTYTTASLSANQFERMVFTSGSANIAYILASGLDSASSGGLDNLSFGDPVPEPGTIVLLSGALASLALVRSRRAS